MLSWHQQHHSRCTDRLMCGSGREGGKVSSMWGKIAAEIVIDKVITSKPPNRACV